MYHIYRLPQASREVAAESGESQGHRGGGGTGAPRGDQGGVAGSHEHVEKRYVMRKFYLLLSVISLSACSCLPRSGLSVRAPALCHRYRSGWQA